MINYGGYFIFADRAEHTPYKWKHGDANLTKLILDGTEFKFRYLTKFQQRIIGAYSDQTNGDLDLRWTDAIPTWASLDFAAANQLYKPGEDSITGVSKFGVNNLFVYGTDSICALQYFEGLEVRIDYVSRFVVCPGPLQVLLERQLWNHGFLILAAVINRYYAVVLTVIMTVDHSHPLDWMHAVRQFYHEWTQALQSEAVSHQVVDFP